MSVERKPPHNVQVLQRWVGDLARQDGIAPARLQRWISFMVVAGILDHARDENLDPLDYDFYPPDGAMIRGPESGLPRPMTRPTNRTSTTSTAHSGRSS